MKISNRKLKKLIREETKNILSERNLPKDFTADIHLGKFGKQCASYVLENLKDRLPRKADIYVDYGPKHLRSSGSFSIIAYTRTDLEYEVDVSVMLAIGKENTNIIEVRIKGPDRGTQREEWSFGMNENPQNKLDKVTTYIISMLGYRT